MPENRNINFEQLRPAFAATGGLLLSQVCDVTKVESSTIQNWVKRGWVQAPTDKRYGEFQVARILIIDTLRPVMSLDRIVALMSFVNGKVDDRSDDIISDSDLYTLIQKGVDQLEARGNLLSEDNVKSIVDEVIGDYTGPRPDSREKLIRALRVMLYGYLSAKLKMRAEREYGKLFG